MLRRLALIVVLALTATLGATGVRPGPHADAATATPPSTFGTYHGTTPLRRIRPGTVLDHRRFSMSFNGLPAPVPVTQLLYRTSNSYGRPELAITTVIAPPVPRFARPRLVSHQYQYDALGAQCNPSAYFAGSTGLSGGATGGGQAESLGYLLAGYTLVVSDYESTELNFLDGPSSGRATIDGVRAALRYRPNRLPARTPVAFVGYSGGSFATAWAGELIKRYAPRLARQVVGFNAGGVPVNLRHNLAYANGTAVWAAAIPLALAGLTRAYHLPVLRYLSAKGRRILRDVQDKCIVDVLGQYPGLTFRSLRKAKYHWLRQVKPFVRVLRRVSLGRGHRVPPAPTTLTVATGIGHGDGIIVADDVRRLARTYCRRGGDVSVTDLPGLEHVSGYAVFIAQTFPWLEDRFAGRPLDGC